MKVALICSPGGHLTQALSLLPAFRGHELFLVLQRFPSVRDTQIEGVAKVYKIRTFFRYSRWLGVTLSLIWSIFALVFIFLRERPRVIFSTGAEIAFPAFLVGKLLFRAKILFLESLTRTEAPSQTGKMVYAISDLFLVQHPDLVSSYGQKAVYRGALL